MAAKFKGEDRNYPLPYATLVNCPWINTPFALFSEDVKAAAVEFVKWLGRFDIVMVIG